MILPKEFFEKIAYFEHTVEHTKAVEVNDVFTIHFNAWWKPRRKIKIARVISDFDEESGYFSHHVTESAADLYNQLNTWATDTFDEKLSRITRKYETNSNDNVIKLKPKPKDINDE
jgi:hypothetical protein